RTGIHTKERSSCFRQLLPCPTLALLLVAALRSFVTSCLIPGAGRKLRHSSDGIVAFPPARSRIVEYTYAMRLALLMVAVNALVFWALWVRVSAAFPARRRRARVLLILAFWLPLLPTMLMPFKADALRVFRSDAPLWLSVPSMAIQFAVLCYGVWLALFAFPAFAALKLRARLRPDVDLSRREWLKRAALVPPAAIIAGSGIGAVGAMRDPVIRTVSLPVPRELTNLHGL